jgi:hypothetical protein
MKKVHYTLEELENIKASAKLIYKSGGDYRDGIMFNKVWHDTIIKLCDQAKNDSQSKI